LEFFTTPSIRAQKDAFLPASFFVFGFGAGGFNLLPVAALYFCRPFAVKPAPRSTDNFSPRPTDNDTPFAIHLPNNIRTAENPVLFLPYHHPTTI
jgi:hypothetical protein